MIQRANPALQEFDRVLAILASENKVLAKLAATPTARSRRSRAVRERVADFVVQSNTVAQASAAHRGALARNLEDFPPFLEQLGPAMERIGRFADQTTPAFTDLDVAAPGINKTFTKLPAFSNSSTTFFKNLGKTSKLSGPARRGQQAAARPPEDARHRRQAVLGQPRRAVHEPRETGGLERIMDFIFLGTGSANGYDSLGHFLRTEVVAVNCLTYAVVKPLPGCNRKLFSTGSATAAQAARIDPSTTGLVMARTLAVVKGATPAQALAKYPGSAPTASELKTLGSGGSTSTSAQPVGGSTAGTTYYTPSAESNEAGGLLLNYLLGN